MARKAKTFREITETLETDDGLSIKDRAAFHYFNPNGAWQEKRRANKAIDDAVEAGLMKSGAILAFGGLNTYHADQVAKLATQKSPRRFNVDYHIAGLKADAAQCFEEIAKAKGESK